LSIFKFTGGSIEGSKEVKSISYDTTFYWIVPKNTKVCFMRRNTYKGPTDDVFADSITCGAEE